MPNLNEGVAPHDCPHPSPYQPRWLDDHGKEMKVTAGIPPTHYTCGRCGTNIESASIKLLPPKLGEDQRMNREVR